MLELQRASAGSGKTFMLAKKFIWYYITIPAYEGGRRRLRTVAELRDSLSHILAVTFTNKATNEMQQRIVEKLFQLAYPPLGAAKKPDYMEDFARELSSEAGEPVTEEEISETCRHAVALLLNNYSDFHISTIDSFFQQVLRTFAYESDLSDSYRIELDTDHLSAMAIDALLEDINSGRDASGAGFWIEELMGRAKNVGKKWNIFAKEQGDNPYTLLIASVKRLENEEFKDIRKEFDEYFCSGADLQTIYKDLKNKYETPLHESYRRLLKAAKDMKRCLDSLEGNIDSKDSTIFRRRIKKVTGSRVTELPQNSKKEAIEDYTPQYSKIYFTRKKKGDTEAYQALEDADLILAEAYNEWVSILTGREFKHWQVYRENFPFMGMLQAIRDKRDEYLRENNAIELGETNAMLHDIIGEDDAPFIYERIGTRLNHFLIDEFQDTSKMQWRNMSPLLHESVARGNENLIIGDAKQSIYRFRNADSSLISLKVPEEFGCKGGEAEAASAQNTNWRSHLHIVQFNNSFFNFLPSRLNEAVGMNSAPERRDFEADYRNVVQNPKKSEEWGYVKVTTKAEGVAGWKEYVLQSIPEIVRDAMQRGYRMRDIAVLVDQKKMGEMVIATLTEYNAQLAPGETRLEYVSEQSLKLSSSAAVAFVVSVLETISRGADPEVRSGDERMKRGVADWSQMACNFKFYALRNPELSTPECLARFFAEGSDNDAISKMLSKMQAVTLPALVESIIAELIKDEEVRRQDAVFLAAFQDLVLEYCEGHPSDIASFLKWWEEKKSRATISSPEDMDAITVMTVHKSKGLEFPIVIVPFANATFKDGSDKIEWRWEKPDVLLSDAGLLPPYIPVATTTIVKGTGHEHVLNEFYDLRKMDALNSIYVAFTRAVAELYIFSKPGPKTTEDKTCMSSLFSAFFSEGIPSSGDVKFMDKKEVCNEAEGVWSYGTKPLVKYELRNKEENEEITSEEEKEKREREILKDYTSHITPKAILYRPEDAPEVVDADDPELSDDPDPRSEGNILHEIMQNVKHEGDIPRAVRRMAIKGLISNEEASQMGAFLTAKIASRDVRDWFRGDWQVINERPILRQGEQMRRPDRVMISPQGDAVVIDYKFGESESTHKRYSRQVRDYVEMLKNTGRFRSVTGYLWYVRLNRVELVAN